MSLRLCTPLPPQAYQRLFVADESPIRDFYPTNFAIDMNGKRFTWQAVVLLPFIDERRLLEAVAEAEVRVCDTT